MDAKLRVYLETTVFNRYLEEGREYANESKLLFNKILDGNILAFTSVAVLEELERAPEPKRSQMMELIQSHTITVWPVEESADTLADVYIEAGIIPPRFRTDGIHIAMAAIKGLDCIISLNFHHINKLKTKTATEVIHRLKGYGNPFICTPAEVVYDDK